MFFNPQLKLRTYNASKNEHQNIHWKTLAINRSNLGSPPPSHRPQAAWRDRWVQRSLARRVFVPYRADLEMDIGHADLIQRLHLPPHLCEQKYHPTTTTPLFRGSLRRVPSLSSQTISQLS